jgi:predicted Fe-Mo cluster-binding NifX family protein
MVAIPVFRSRVAPVLNWCTRVVLIDPQQAGISVLDQLEVDQLDPFRRLRLIHGKGVDTVICGTLSQELLLYAESLGMKVLYGISGEISEVVEAYRGGWLHEARFRLPGCRSGQSYRQYRRRFDWGSEPPPWPNSGCVKVREAQGAGAGRCVCARCGESVPHEPGIPCHLTKCPHCGGDMTRA